MLFPFSFEEYFKNYLKNPREAISNLKEDYKKLEEANQTFAQNYKTLSEIHEQGAKYYSSLIKQLEFAENQQELFAKFNPFNLFNNFKEFMEKYANINKEKEGD